MPKISIIVPCYNIAPYLVRCLDSLISQTLTDIEIICVDDKSTDNTLDILHDYAKQDKRINVIALKKNQGVSVARNTGINIARGEYIGFVDPDDYVDLDFYEKLYTRAVETGADIVKAQLATVTIDKEIKLSRLRFATKYDFCVEFSTAIYRRQMLIKNNITFPIGLTLGEDIVFLSKAVFVCKTFASVSDTNYWYIRRPGSADSASRCLSQDTVCHHVKIYKDLLQLTAGHKTSDKNVSYIYQQVFNLIRWIFPKALDATQSVLAENMVFVYNECPDKSLIDRQIPPKLQKALIHKDPEKIFLILKADNTRFRIFGFIPFLKISKYGKSQTDYRLFDFIPVIVIKRTSNSTKFYIFKILLIKIKK